MSELSISGTVQNNGDEGIGIAASNSDMESGEEEDATPSSHHMSNSKYEELDCENDAGGLTTEKGNKIHLQSQEEDEPPRKRPRRDHTRDVNGKIEFEIIDEIEADEEDHGNGDDSDDDDLSDDEIYAWLEEGVDKNVQAEKDDSIPVEREKVVLKEKGHDPFDILPEGWVVVTHNSGMPVYLHKESRVCTLARPYFLGPGSVRKHDIPLSAIPCLQYKREIEKENTNDANSIPEELEQTTVKENEVSDTNTEKQNEVEAGNTINCVDLVQKTAGIMETNSSGQETSSALAFGSVRNISKTGASQDEEPDKTATENPDEEKSSSILVTNAMSDSSKVGAVGGKNQLVTSQSETCPFKPVQSSVNVSLDETEMDCAENENISCATTSAKPAEVSVESESVNAKVTLEGASIIENGIAGSNTGGGRDCENGAVDSTSRETTQGDQRVEVHPVKVESAEERRKQASLDPPAVREYCSRLFEFRTITVRKYKTWRDRRRHMTQMKKQSRPELPPNTKLITCSLNVQLKPGDFKSTKRKEFLLNPSGKSYVCILHEYVQHTMRVQPRYIFKEMESALTPYSATVVINDVEYGVGYASSKKAAKLEAAKDTLNILIPEMNKVTDDQKGEGEDLSFFDEIKIEDPRIYELGNKAGQPSPYQILCECLRRNYGLGETHCEMEMKQLKHQKSEFTMTVGKHTATVIAKNKRDGKQRAAQAILQKLHSHVTSWGSLLRLYGKCSEKYFAEKKDEMNINELQAQVKANRPNNAILDKLKEEMTRLHMQRGAIQSKGKLHLETTELPAKVPSLDL
ncbi:microprocessor complex subunit DGCR8-like isoform X1 [Haliotis rufescens]|uniref:microprocessor complex subunit DGCR8-like isoform X1 n=1 Tax=Haliotis rufescens TaxID=6454 RepID=UPI00201E7B72|nr:microprocessor complex subunit DGCR8-like isoform X1 [Haliotis rufescens]XP_046361350.2 microprocessor complex subunit DGCR8-like isoform X1 [Haliotis rufescens]XP_048252204.1 microprocessor complex subunit DGCR8-like isoform X1 [Haliotis rufescens]